ncbi:hypothetical protein GEV33_003396 [Tenebrio molitor]|uniref:PWWP domain-containing protein n=1 Tax=Tenebrio molitor TaxID=7067 RepID=A0A8J6LFC9_TENMO|nr:hypothetical protein GEV33_003396 [Tenebrio molitor]
MGHSGEAPSISFVKLKEPPKNNKERLDVIRTMHAHSQYCWSGDHTLEAVESAVNSLAEEDCDEAIVIVLSDANLERYSIPPSKLAAALTAKSNVSSYVIFIGGLGDQAERLTARLPAGRAFICSDLGRSWVEVQRYGADFVRKVSGKCPFGSRLFVCYVGGLTTPSRMVLWDNHGPVLGHVPVAPVAPRHLFLVWLLFIKSKMSFTDPCNSAIGTTNRDRIQEESSCFNERDKMSEEECPKYKDGDIVWVKLGPCWWPGEVTENGPEDFTSKKPPLAIVKFFNESTYEFVKSHNNIYFYNCDRKNEFIKKGMDSFRGNNSHMEKFPGDVSLAEMRTEGNPNILSDPMFAPQKKSNVIAEVFGSPSPKKTPKDGPKQPRGRGSKNSGKKPKINITHRRFLGCDDYEAHIRVQYPGKDTGHLSSDEEVAREEIARLNAEPTKSFNCSSCTFETNRLEVMLFHVQCHIKGIASPVQVKKKALPKKKKRIIHKHITSDDDRTNSSAGFVDTDSEEEIKPKPKRRRRAPGSGKKPKQKKSVEEEKTATDIRTNLLAEWSDSEENEEGETTKLDTSGDSVEETKEDAKETKSEDQSKDLSKSCFDFEEEEEEDNSIVHTAVGRKIPRVIPPNDKRKSTDPDNEDASLPVAEDDENRMEILKVNENLNDNSNPVQNDAEVGKEEEERCLIQLNHHHRIPSTTKA